MRQCPPRLHRGGARVKGTEVLGGVELIMQRQPGGKPGTMLHEVAQGDATVGEVREELLHQHVRMDDALGASLGCDCRGDEHLCQRGEVKKSACLAA